MSFKAEDLRVGDVVTFEPDGRIAEFHEMLSDCCAWFENLPWGGSGFRYCFKAGLIKKVHRDGKQIYPVLENAHTDAGLSANSNREEG